MDLADVLLIIAVGVPFASLMLVCILADLATRDNPPPEDKEQDNG